MEVINILERYSDKNTERVIKALEFLFAPIWSYFAHS